MTSEYTPNPPWVDRILAKHADAILARAPVEWVPAGAHEYGKGHYGAVSPTWDEEVVVKVTSDATEAMFVVAALSLSRGDWPAGMTRYYKIYELPEKFRGRRTFILWRADAHDVGKVHTASRLNGLERRHLQIGLEVFREVATIVRDPIRAHGEDILPLLRSASRDVRERALDVSHDESIAYDSRNEFNRIGRSAAQRIRAAFKQDPVGRVLCALDWLATTSMLFENENILLSPIGAAFGYYLEKGMLLADVHLGNIGLAAVDNHSGDDNVVITDPGHMVPLEERWFSVRIPSLY